VEVAVADVVAPVQLADAEPRQAQLPVVRNPHWLLVSIRWILDRHQPQEVAEVAAERAAAAQRALVAAVVVEAVAVAAEMPEHPQLLRNLRRCFSWRLTPRLSLRQRLQQRLP
jgi:hypothetical protein